MAYGRKTGGRQAGTPNRTTAAVRDAVLEALDRLGGVDYLVRVAKAEPRAFLSLLGKLIPRPSGEKMDEPTWIDILNASWEPADAGSSSCFESVMGDTTP